MAFRADYAWVVVRVMGSRLDRRGRGRPRCNRGVRDGSGRSRDWQSVLGSRPREDSLPLNGTGKYAAV